MKITPSQIQELYAITRQHFVEHYDMQTELVDHLANDIEQIWQEYPNLSFNEARSNAFKKFGVFGFMEIVEQRQKALGNRYNKILWQYVKEWFQLPKIIKTLALVFVTAYILQMQIGVYIFLGILFVLTTIELVKALQLRKQAKKRFKVNGKKWMLEDIIFQLAYLNSFFLGCNFLNIFNILVKDPLSPMWAFIVACIFVVALIYSYMSLIVLPSKTDQLLRDLYPEYSIS